MFDPNLVQNDLFYGYGENILLSLFQIISHSKNLGESKHFQVWNKIIIERNTNICNIKWVYYKNIIKEESNDT